VIPRLSKPYFLRVWLKAGWVTTHNGHQSWCVGTIFFVVCCASSCLRCETNGDAIFHSFPSYRLIALVNFKIEDPDIKSGLLLHSFMIADFRTGWNMGNARADEFGRVIPAGGGDYDIIVLGLQEATWSLKKEPRKSMDPSSFSDQDDKKSEPDCVRQLLNDLNEVFGPEFPLVCCPVSFPFFASHSGQVVRNRRVQMQQLVFARQSVRERITKIEKFAENTGFFHVFPNKVCCSRLPSNAEPRPFTLTIGRPTYLIYHRPNKHCLSLLSFDSSRGQCLLFLLSSHRSFREFKIASSEMNLFKRFLMVS
jgi:hypothetical protein